MKIKEGLIIAIFGASGDLTRRKLIPALFNLYKQNLLPERFAVLGASRRNYSDEEFRQKSREHMQALISKSGLTSQEVNQFINYLHYISIDTSSEEGYKQFAERLSALDREKNTDGNCIFYLSTPPGLYETIATNIGKLGLADENPGWKRIIVEKPFGYDLQSSLNLNKVFKANFNENQIYRIDHYLGKETVQNILVARFGNGIFEPLWNRNYIHHVEITSSESIGVENRGGYYDKSGATRDMVQNHLLQVLGFVAMEPPALANSRSIRNETVKVFQSLRPLNKKMIDQQVIRGQYTRSEIKGQVLKAYRQEEGVDPNSRTETFVAMKLFVDNWRWNGVPFYIRTGKRLPTRVTEIVIHFKESPHKLFCNSDSKSVENQLIIRIQPDEGLLLKVGLKVPGAGFKVQMINMDFHYADVKDIILPEAYERLLLDCMSGDSTLYARGDALEETWRFIDPVLKYWETNPGSKIYGYPSGTWGPKEADSLFDEGNTWRYPCKNLSDDGIYCEL